MNMSAALTPCIACLARSMSACAAGQSFQSIGPEQAGRCWNGEANCLSNCASSGNSSSPVPIGGALGTFVTGEPAHHVHGVIGAALFAVIDDIDAAFDLLAHDLRDRLAHRGLQFGAAQARVFALRPAAARPPSACAAGCRCGS